MYHGGVPDSSRTRGEPPAIALEPEAETAVRLRIGEVVRELVNLVISTSPMHEVHRGLLLPERPATSDQALELVRAATVVGQELHRAINRAQFDGAVQAVLLGTQLKDVATATGVTASAISRRWPTLGRMRSTHEWFRVPANADAWAKACVGLREVAADLRGTSQTWAAHDSENLTCEVGRLVRMASDYEQARRREFDSSPVTLLQWYEMVLLTPGMIETLINPRLITASTPLAQMALDHLSAVWRAYRTGATVDYQEQSRADSRPPPTAGS